ncbi:MAG: hypothetical protein FJ279_31635 [Planctomycetes bacterium]|nr:hypothetical protein [Planctomycetota bacterium]MBM4080857.1 hypothetical protein [Planctomycetota bacterium]MBM4087588.1 hypothetical protein [Planctomycetota bacterium]
MKTISVPPRAKRLNDLLRKARRKQVLLQAADGQRFVLASVEGWEGFEVGEDDDITTNKKLMQHLARRRRGGKRIALAEVRARLGLP